MGEYVEDCFLPHPFQPIQNPLIQCHGADEVHFTNWETNGKIGYVCNSKHILKETIEHTLTVRF